MEKVDHRYVSYSKKAIAFLIGIPAILLIIAIIIGKRDFIIVASIIFYIACGQVAFRKAAYETENYYIKNFATLPAEEGYIWAIGIGVFGTFGLIGLLIIDLFKKKMSNR